MLAAEDGQRRRRGLRAALGIIAELIAAAEPVGTEVSAINLKLARDEGRAEGRDEGYAAGRRDERAARGAQAATSTRMQPIAARNEPATPVTATQTSDNPEHQASAT